MAFGMRLPAVHPKWTLHPFDLSSGSQPRLVACRSADRWNGGRTGRNERHPVRSYTRSDACLQRQPSRPPLTGIPPTPPKYTEFTDGSSNRSRGGQHLSDPPSRRGVALPLPIIRNPSPDTLSEIDLDLELANRLAAAEDDDEVASEASSASSTASLGDARSAFERIMNPVVKVYCRHTEPNFSLPWQRERQFSSSSSGFAVAFGEPDEHGNQPRWLLTNGHAVEYHSQVRVKRRGDDKKFLARVLAIGTECDLALLTVDDEAFWKDIEPMQLGEMPSLQESVAVVGYPVGGDTISITAGVVSRIEVTTYVHGSTQLLGVQIDAAINSGNSGGPVFDESGSLVGIAFQSYAGSEVENVGWVIPTCVVSHFLNDFQRNSKYTGFPMLGVQWQRMESDALKRHMKMADDQRGVLVTHVAATSCSAGVLRTMDVLMKFDGSQVSCDGTVAFRTGERIMFSYLVSQRFVGDKIPLTVLRDGEKLDLEVVLSTPAPLVPPHLASRDPEYFVFSGLVFTAASEPYLASEYGADFLSLAPVALLDKVCYGRPREADEQVVLLSQVLACDATVGFEDVTNEQVMQFNGKPVKNLVQLVRMIQEAQHEEFLVFDLDHDEVLVLDAQQAQESTAEILKVHNIPRQMSEGLELQLSNAPPS